MIVELCFPLIEMYSETKMYHDFKKKFLETHPDGRPDNY